MLGSYQSAFLSLMIVAAKMLVKVKKVPSKWWLLHLLTFPS